MNMNFLLNSRIRITTYSSKFPIFMTKPSLNRVQVNVFGLSGDTSVAHDVRFYSAYKGNENVTDQNTEPRFWWRYRLSSEHRVPKDMYDALFKKLEEQIVKRVKAEVKFENLRVNAIKVYVAPYLGEKLSIYADCWNSNEIVDSIKNFDSYFGVKDLDVQTFADYESNSKQWNNILHKSKATGANRFKKKLQEVLPKESLENLAKGLGLTEAVLNNVKHGVVRVEPTIVGMIDSDALVIALKSWKSLANPELLTIIKTFQDVTTGASDEK